MDSELKEGQVILEGRYRIAQLIYKRPRLNLYLGWRLSTQVIDKELDEGEREPLVAIRELVLSSLPETVQAQIEAAAFEEFVSPGMPGSPRLPESGDRVWFERERHYLVMQLCKRKHDVYSEALTLDELLLGCREWPVWLGMEVALNWGIQLCRIVARLHHLGMIAGFLDPATILVSDSDAARWAPILLPSWPPPLQFWQASPVGADLCRQVFPIAVSSMHNAFVAPEMLAGVCDERSDVYALGAILYLLFTHYAPAAPLHRLQAVQQIVPSGEENSVQSIANGIRELDVSDGLELILPHLLYEGIALPLEQIVLRALELDPARRYPSVFALVEALEVVELENVVSKEKRPGEAKARKTKMRIGRRAG